MGLFGRKDQESAPDAALPFMTVAEAQEVRRLAAAAFAAAGHEVVIGDDRLTAADGQVYGLWNLAAACKAERTRLTWPKVVKRHVAQLLDVPPGPQDMAVEDVVAHAVLRVYGTQDIAPQTRDQLTYATQLADGLIETIVLDTPTAVMMLLDDDVERCGYTTLRTAARRHLMAEPLGRISRFTVPGAVLELIEGESVYTASKVLVLPRVLDRVYGERQYPDGVLVAVPDRHHLVLHPIDDASVVPTLKAAAPAVAELYWSSAGRVSPSVYWWRDGQFERVSCVIDDDTVRVLVGPELAAVLNRLTADG